MFEELRYHFVKAVFYEQLNLFSDCEKEKQIEQDEKKIQNAILDVKEKYGKNAILLGINLLEGATTIKRNKQIGGHKA